MKKIMINSKKAYQKPSMEVYQIQTKKILLTSGNESMNIEPDPWPLVGGEPLLPW